MNPDDIIEDEFVIRDRVAGTVEFQRSPRMVHVNGSDPNRHAEALRLWLKDVDTDFTEFMVVNRNNSDDVRLLRIHHTVAIEEF